MSVTTPSESADRETYECERDGCETSVEADKLVKEEYCSWDCYHRDEGEPLLNLVENDHRFCYNCFRQKKELERPGQDTSVVVGPVRHEAAPDVASDVLIGYQHLTEHAELDSYERNRRDVVLEDIYTTAPADRVVTGGAVCTCGTTDHRDDWQRAEHLTSVADAAERLAGVLEHTRREGQHNKRIDAKTLVETLTETARADGTPDWALAVGRAIIDD